jgi:DUF438 domain-containing protein
MGQKIEGAKMEKVQELTKILKRLNSGEDPAEVKEQAKEFLATIDAKDLSVAEQNLIDEGLSAGDMQRLCTIHMELLKDQVEKMISQLPPGHVVSTLVSEHESILCFLDTLETVNKAVQKMDGFDSERDEFRKLANIAEHLVAAELHHQREEEILFPELESRGINGPPMIMRAEHTQLRQYKQQLKQLSENAAHLDFDELKQRLDKIVEFIVPTLREHIFKENNILYPAALQVIEDESIWENLKAECDKIGYCCFTPQNQ